MRGNHSYDLLIISTLGKPLNGNLRSRFIHHLVAGIWIYGRYIELIHGTYTPTRMIRMNQPALSESTVHTLGEFDMASWKNTKLGDMGIQIHGKSALSRKSTLDQIWGI